MSSTNTFADLSYIKSSIKNANGLIDSIDLDIKECKKIISLNNLNSEVNNDSVMLLKKKNSNLMNIINQKDEEISSLKSQLVRNSIENNILKEKKKASDQAIDEENDYKLKFYTCSSELERLQENANKILDEKDEVVLKALELEKYCDSIELRLKERDDDVKRLEDQLLLRDKEISSLKTNLEQTKSAHTASESLSPSCSISPSITASTAALIKSLEHKIKKQNNLLQKKTERIYELEELLNAVKENKKNIKRDNFNHQITHQNGSSPSSSQKVRIFYDSNNFEETKSFWFNKINQTKKKGNDTNSFDNGEFDDESDDEIDDDTEDEYHLNDINHYGDDEEIKDIPQYNEVVKDRVGFFYENENKVNQVKSEQKYSENEKLLEQERFIEQKVKERLVYEREKEKELQKVKQKEVQTQSLNSSFGSEDEATLPYLHRDNDDDDEVIIIKRKKKKMSTKEHSGSNHSSPSQKKVFQKSNSNQDLQIQSNGPNLSRSVQSSLTITPSSNTTTSTSLYDLESALNQLTISSANLSLPSSSSSVQSHHYSPPPSSKNDIKASQMAKGLLENAFMVASQQQDDPSSFSLETNTSQSISTKDNLNSNTNSNSVQRVFYLKNNNQSNQSPLSSSSSPMRSENSIEKEFLKTTSSSKINSIYSPFSNTKSHLYLDPFQDESSPVIGPLSTPNISNNRYPANSHSFTSTPTNSLYSSQNVSSNYYKQYSSYSSHPIASVSTPTSSFSSTPMTTTSSHHNSPRIIKHNPVSSQYTSLELEDLSDSLDFHNNIQLEDIMSMDFN